MPPALAFQSLIAAFDARWPDGRRRAGSIGLALALELLLLLVLLTLGARTTVHQPRGDTVSTFDVRDQSPRSEKQKSAPAPAAQAARPSPLTPPPQAVRSPSPVQSPPPALVLPRPVTTPPPAAPVPSPAPTTPKITAVIRSDMATVRGPQGSAGASGDSERIAGSGPNGEPLYRAEWYREPYHDELTGYLDYVKQDAWALINCQTQPQYRVDHCVLVDEWPQGSNMGRAILAAAWQFKVRPPRVGGKVLVGEWVRIKIDYTIKRK